MWGAVITPRPKGVREGTVLLLLEIAGTVEVRPWRNATPAKNKAKQAGGGWHKHPHFSLILPLNLRLMPLFGGIQ